MVIIVEGIDRVGKTTLCEMIEDRYRDTIGFRRFRDDTRYAHSHLNRAVNTEKINTLQNLLEVGFIDNIILDRYHITEYVYGAIERSYKNFDMYDIDKRLSIVGGPDYKSAEPDDLENIDSAMMVDPLYHTDVVLIYMVPTSIKKSSDKHGYNLERHLLWFNGFYRNSKIEKKISVDYYTMDLALEFIDEILGIKEGEESEEPIVPEEPIDPPVDEGEEESKGEEVGGEEVVETSLEDIIKNSKFFNVNRGK